jgi:TP901 family phage tail tape measure protein
MAVQVKVTLNPVDTSKVDAALARIQSKAKGVDFGGGARSIEKLSRPLGKITGQATDFEKSLQASNARVLAFGASVVVINKLSEAFGSLVRNTIKVEATFAKIGIILGGTNKQLQDFGNGIFDVARKTATSFDDVAEGALELARQGLGVEESLSRVETALKLVRVAGVDSQQAVSGLTAAIKGFQGAGETVVSIADKLAEVDTKFAVSTEDLINGLERASASARVAGVSFDELLGLVTTVQERTQRGGAVIGNAFKTIFARLGRTDTLSSLESLGISVQDAEGNVRSAVPLFKDLAVLIDSLGIKSEEAGEVIQKVAGVRQRDILISLIEDLNSGQSQFASVLEKAAGATGKLDQKNEALNKTLEALINNLVVGGQKLSSVLGELGFSDAAKDILKLFSSVVNGITDLLQGDSVGAKFAQGIVKGIGSILTGPGIALVGAIFTKLFIDLAKFGGGSLKQLLGINKAADLQNTLQKSVLQTLLQNESIQREILALEGNKVAQEQLLLKIYNQQAAALARVQKTAAAVTPALFKGGLRGGEAGISKPAGRASEGYVAAESRDVSRGVGGAPSSAKVVSIPNFAFGGGKRGTMVANTSEYVVPNYAGGGDAIFNQDMVKTMGLPDGAKKLNAAGGFIPNFAKFNDLTASGNRFQDTKTLLRASADPKFRPPNIAGFGSLSNEETKAIIARGKQTRGATAKQTGARAAAKKKKTDETTILDARPYSYLVPQFNFKKSIRQSNPFKFKGINGSFSLRNLNIRGPKIPGGVDEAGNPEDEFLENNIRKSLVDQSVKYGNILSKQVGGNNIKPAGLNQAFRSGGTRGAFGALRGAVGAAFEVSTAKALGIRQAAVEKSGADFDITKSNKKLGALFGAQGRKSIGDFKVSDSSGNIKSFARKIALKEGKLTKSAAGGYIPNFARGALDEAVAREQAAGLPLNQIRINQSGKLRNSQNPGGIAVTNTRDEPTGRIPNFAKKPQPKSDELGSGGSSGIFALFALQAASTGLINTLGDQNETVKNFGEGLSGLLNTLIVLQTIGLGPNFKDLSLGSGKAGKALGKLTGGFKGTGSKLAGLTKFVGPVAVGFGALDAVLKAGGAGGIVGAFDVLSGNEKKRKMDEVEQSQLEALEGGKFIGTGDEGVIAARNQVNQFESKVGEETTNLKRKAFSLEKEETSKQLIAQEKNLARAQEQLKLATERLSNRRTTEARVQSGELVKRKAAVVGVKGAFARRAGGIREQAAESNSSLELKLLKEIGIIEKSNLQFSLEKNNLIEEIALKRNESLEALTVEAINSKQIGLLEKEKLTSILESVDAQTDSVDLAKLLEAGLSLSAESARDLALKAVENVEATEQELKIKSSLLKTTQKLVAAEAKRAKIQKDIEQSSSKLASVRKSTFDKGALTRETTGRELDLESKKGPVSSQRQREVSSLKEELSLNSELASLKQKAAESAAAADEVATKARQGLIEITDASIASTALLAEADEKRLEKLLPLIEAEKELALARGQMSGFELGVEDLDQEILDFEDTLGRQIPGLFSNNLGQALTEAVSGAKDLDDALSDAGRNFLGFIRDAFLQQAASQFTSGLFGGGGDGQKTSGLLSGAVDGVKGFFGGGKASGATGATGAAGGAEAKSGGVGGILSGIFGGGGGGGVLGSTPSNPMFVKEVGNMKLGLGQEGADKAAGGVAEQLTGEGSGSEGIFSRLKSTLMESFGGLKNIFGNLFGGLKDSFGTMFKGLTSNLGSLFSGLGGGGGGGGMGGLFTTVLGAFGFATGGPVGFANGGSVGSTDTVPAMLTPGEFVVKKSSVDKYGTDFLSNLNRGMLPMQGFQNGGTVSPVSSESGTGGAGAGQVNNNSDFTFNIQDGKVNQEGGQSSTEDQQEFATRVRSAVTTVIQEESRSGGTLNYLYKK